MAAYKTNCYKCGVEVVKKKRCENPICKECKKEYQKEYCKNHKKEKQKYDKEYQEKNKEYLKEQKKEYYQENKEDIREQQKEYNKRPEVKERRREYNEKNKEYLKEKKKEYREKNKDKIREYNQRPEVKERRREYINEYHIKRYKTDLNFNIACKLRCRLKIALKNNYKHSSMEGYLGCSLDYFKKYFESKFIEEMTWRKFMDGEIHIDHVIPCSAFNLKEKEEQMKCFNYKNLQPMWAEENLKKGAKTV